jgi:hypothetical protein
MHSVQHVSLLDLAADDPLSDQVIAPPSLIKINNKKKYLVEDILDFKIHYHQLKYLVK